MPHPLVVHCKQVPEGSFVYIGRPGPWGNPFRITSEADRTQTLLDKYEAWFRSQPELVAKARRELRGKKLGCWCAPKLCHGDVLAKVAAEPDESLPTPPTESPVSQQRPMRLKALSIRQPWVDLIVNGSKRVENRDWKGGSSFRGDFLIHASSSMTRREYDDVARMIANMGLSDVLPAPETLTLGALIAVAKVVDVIAPGGCVQGTDVYHSLEDDPYYMGGFALVLSNIRPLVKPVKCKGSLGFFQPDLSAMEQVEIAK